MESSDFDSGYSSLNPFSKAEFKLNSYFSFLEFVEVEKVGI